MQKFAIIALFALFLCSCDRQGIAPEPEKETLYIESNEKTIPTKGGEFFFSVRANCKWTLSIDSDWVYIVEPKSSYEGNCSLHFIVKENKSVVNRTASCSFKYSQDEVKLRIIQDLFIPYLSISENELFFGYRTAEKIINVSSNCGWEAVSNAAWLAIRPSTGLVGLFEMTVNSETNNTTVQRTASVRITNSTYGLEQVVAVTQNGKPEIEDKDYIDEYGVNYGKGVLLRGLIWAPVNCGYKENDFPYGKIFQWGRKSGIGYHGGSYNDKTKTIISDIWDGDNGMEDSSSYYKYGDGSKYGYDWLIKGDNTFWNLGTEENPLKNNAYDPCPEGWRIPTAFEFKSLADYVDRDWEGIDGIYGQSFYDGQKHMFLPAGGRINSLDGVSCDRNIEGYYWTISASDGYSAYLFFYEKDCSVNLQGSRAGGCLVRCVRE